ncbi:hypothetical protein GXY_12908 [Novacetimonas hansenii ATCC 23769]|uniref:Uncharacterized protein n=1 Tax=Novacetimonas hansenii ATCC 23769 TaxID=714995 RepID=D5QH92_NOVHA|nr:hypothetical protein GXY_12908 [Novacetimonas hansenii ATCC 23769]
MSIFYPCQPRSRLRTTMNSMSVNAYNNAIVSI